jgi:hypothetical protein
LSRFSVTTSSSFTFQESAIFYLISYQEESIKGKDAQIQCLVKPQSKNPIEQLIPNIVASSGNENSMAKLLKDTMLIARNTWK